MNNVAELAQNLCLPDWLVKAWKFYGRKVAFDMDMADWLEAYPDLLGLIARAKGLLEAWPTLQQTLEDGKTPATCTIRLKPATVELLRKQIGERQVRRQKTVNGKAVDLRNRRGHMILTCPVQNLVVLVRHWENIALYEPYQRMRHAAEINLETALACRTGNGEPTDLPDQVRLEILDTLAKVARNRVLQNANSVA
jgi:hypothetical protein